MVVWYIDAEHDRVIEHAELGPSHQGKLEEARTRLAAAAGQPCLSLRFSEVSPTLVE